MSEKNWKITTTENREIRVSDEETFAVDFTTLHLYNFIPLKSLDRIEGESDRDYNDRVMLHGRSVVKKAQEFLQEKNVNLNP